MSRLVEMLHSGELARLAQGCRSLAELAQRSGIPYNTLKNRLRAHGVTLDGLQRGEENIGAAQAVDEQTTQPVDGLVRERWPNTSAFLDDVPLPALPDGFRVHKVSTLVDATTGESKLQWIKATNQNGADPVAVLRAAFGDDGPPRIERVPGPVSTDDDILAVIAHGDPHLGQLSWHEDAGENHDLAIAERHLMSAARHLIDIAPRAGQCLLIWIGDNTHSDGQSNTTTKGTRVDVDGRTTKMLAVAIRAFKAEVYMALEKFGHVHGIIERGNHDELLSAVVAMAVAQHFENEPRVTIDVSPEVYHFYRFGQNLIGTHHGDKAKPVDLLGVMAVDRAKDWGETKHRRWYCGHIHHEVVKEVPGVTVEYLRTIAPSDAWHRAQGYRAGRDLRLDVFHREYGLINRSIVGIQQIIDGAA